MIRQLFFQLFVCAAFLSLTANANEAGFSTGNAPHKTRVVIAHERGATEMFLAVPEKLPVLVERGLTKLTGKTPAKNAWLTFVATNDVVGIKVFSSPGANSGTRATVVDAVIRSLLTTGLPATNIIVFDKNLIDLRRGGFLALADTHNVRVVATAQAGWSDKAFYENSILGTPVWGDLEFGRKGDDVGRRSYVSKLLTDEITKVISIAPLLNHNLTGVTGHIYSLASGSVDNEIRFEHNLERLSTAIPEIYALPELYDRVVLNITDALICQYQGEQQTVEKRVVESLLKPGVS